MKNSTLLATTVALTVIVVAGARLIGMQTTPEQPKASWGAGMGNDAEDRLNWELRRLAAPDGKIPDNIRAKELAYASTLPVNNSNPMNRSSFTGWVNRGPGNVGGRTRAFGVDKLNENNLLAGTCSGGIWRSADKGNTWTMVTPSSSYHGVTCMQQDQRSGHETTWYAGSGEAYGASASGGGAYYLGNGMVKSTDNGLTWSPIASTNLGQASSFTSSWQIIWNIALDKHNKSQDVVYAALYGAVLKSVNGGTSWTTFKATNAYFTDVAVNDSGAVYATFDSTASTSLRGIWRSPDGVSPSANITPVNFPKGYNRIVMGFNPKNINEVYFLANTPHHGMRTVNFLGDPEWNSLWKYTYVSGNGTGSGGVWKDLTANLPDRGTYFDTWCVQGSYDMIVRVKPDDSNTVYIGGTNLYRSTSAFSDSTHTTKIGGYAVGGLLPVINSYPGHHPDQHVLAFSPSNPGVMYSCNDGGIFRTNDDMASTVSWSVLNYSYVTSMFYTVALDHAVQGNNILIGGAQDNGSWYTNTTNPSMPWAKPGGGDGSYCAVADSQKAYYFSIQNGKMIKALLDGNGSVTSFKRIDPIGGKGYQFINPFILDPNNNNIMYLAGGKNIWRNDNLAGIPLTNTWDSISTNWVKFPDTVATSKSTITALAVSKTPANRLYYGTDKQKVYRLDNANTGVPSPPTDITGSMFPASGFVSCIAVDPASADHLLVTFSNYGVYSVFQSTNGGTSWTKQGGNLEQDSVGSGNGPSVRWASIMPVSDGYVYLVGTSTGIYATDSLKGLNTVWIQQGAAWGPSGSISIGNSVCDMIDFRSSDGLVAVATHANGIFSANITSTGAVSGLKNQLVVKLGLNTYPNPFHDRFTAAFNLTEEVPVKLSLYDEQGRVCRVLDQGRLAQGFHSLLISRDNLPPGMYYLGLQAGQAIETRKMLILD
ncbi:MAG: T9SS type A sorting domain-containing protein [Bacteroidia bacterium]